MNSILASPEEPFRNYRRKEVLHVTALAVHLVNRGAKACKDPTIQRQFYRSKDNLLSVMLDMAIPDVVPSWERQRNGRYLLKISFPNHTPVHCPFRRLTTSAQCRILERIGPAPGRFC
jgi:hypothetical protein